MTSQLSIYNGALSILGERKIADLTENREPRYKLDAIWDNDFIDRVLQHGQWNFATRSMAVDYEPSITPDFGYQYAFEKPSDFIRTLAFCSDEYFHAPETNYSDEAGYWFSDLEKIYVKIVSNDSLYGTDLSLWPANFTEYVEHYLAYKVAPTLTGIDINESKLEKMKNKALKDARSTDAMEGPAKFPPKGNWARSRSGGQSRDRGSRTSLIG